MRFLSYAYENKPAVAIPFLPHSGAFLTFSHDTPGSTRKRPSPAERFKTPVNHPSSAEKWALGIRLTWRLQVWEMNVPANLRAVESVKCRSRRSVEFWQPSVKRDPRLARAVTSRETSLQEIHHPAASVLDLSMTAWYTLRTGRCVVIFWRSFSHLLVFRPWVFWNCLERYQNQRTKTNAPAENRTVICYICLFSYDSVSMQPKPNVGVV